jgi:hypothetical protein
VIDGSKGEAGLPDFSCRNSQTFKGLRAGNFVDKMPVDVDERCAIRRQVDDVIIPNFVKEGLGSHADRSTNGRTSIPEGTDPSLALQAQSTGRCLESHGRNGRGSE